MYNSQNKTSETVELQIDSIMFSVKAAQFVHLVIKSPPQAKVNAEINCSSPFLLASYKIDIGDLL